jgi:uncharacterized protein (DUF2236 family)
VRVRPGTARSERERPDAIAQAAALTRITPFDGAAELAIRSVGTVGRVLTLGALRRWAELTGMRMPPPEADPSDPPWCGAGSVSWVIHGDPVVTVAAVLALWTQALHPLALAGVMDHSDFEEHPVRRAIRTALFVQTTTFGPGSEARRACEKVNAVHSRIKGSAPDGRPYRADDPELVDWIHCALLLSTARVWLLYGHRPEPRLLDTYVAEQARVPRELGDLGPPLSWAQLLDRIDVHRRSLAVNEQTRWLGEWLARPVLPGSMRVAIPAYRLTHAFAVAAAPAWVRAMWGASMPVTPVRAAGKFLLNGIGGLTGPHRSSRPTAGRLSVVTRPRSAVRAIGVPPDHRPPTSQDVATDSRSRDCANSHHCTSHVMGRR